MPKVLQSNFRVTVSGGSPNIPGFWATFEGGALTREVGLGWDGGGDYDLMPGKATAEDITITRPYEPQQDDGWINQLQRNINNGEVNAYALSKQPLGPRKVSLGRSTTYPGCVPKTVRLPNVAAGAGTDAATVEIVFASKGPAN